MTSPRYEKKWGKIYPRGNKLHRAKQLGFEYPRISESEMVERATTNVLFICSMNQWRSPTAEKIYSARALLHVRSAGTSHKARRKVTSVDIKWADIVIVMEQKHRQFLLAKFPGEMKFKEIHVLEIPDRYQYQDPELIDELTQSIDPIID